MPKIQLTQTLPYTPCPSVLSQLKTLLIQILISENTVMAQLPLRSAWLGCMAGGCSDWECHLRVQGIQPFIKGIVKLAASGNDSEDLTSSFSSLLDMPWGWGPVLSPAVCLSAEWAELENSKVYSSSDGLWGWVVISLLGKNLASLK